MNGKDFLRTAGMGLAGILTLRPSIAYSSSERIVDKYFDGETSFKKMLAKGIERKLKASEISEQELDKVCKIAEPEFPSYQEYQRDPSKITGYVYCVVSTALLLGVPEVVDKGSEYQFSNFLGALEEISPQKHRFAQ